MFIMFITNVHHVFSVFLCFLCVKRQLCTRCVSEQVSKSSGDPGPCLYTGQKYKRSLSPIMRGVDDRILLSMCDRDTCRPTSCNKYEYY